MRETHTYFEENIFDRKITKKGKHNHWNMGYFVYPKQARIVVHVLSKMKETYKFEMLYSDLIL